MRVRARKLSVVGTLLIIAPFAAVYYLSTWPTYSFSEPDEAGLVISFKKVTEREHVCDEAELRAVKEKGEQKLKHMRRPGAECGSRNRLPVGLRILVDGVQVMSKEIQPNGVNKDMPVYMYEKMRLKAGDHSIIIDMRDSKKPKDKYDYHFELTRKLSQQEVVVIGFSAEINNFAEL